MSVNNFLIEFTPMCRLKPRSSWIKLRSLSNSSRRPLFLQRWGQNLQNRADDAWQSWKKIPQQLLSCFQTRMSDACFRAVPRLWRQAKARHCLFPRREMRKEDMCLVINESVCVIRNSQRSSLSPLLRRDAGDAAASKLRGAQGDALKYWSSSAGLGRGRGVHYNTRAHTRAHTTLQNHPGKVFSECSKNSLFLLDRSKEVGAGKWGHIGVFTHRQAHWLDTPHIMYIDIKKGLLRCGIFTVKMLNRFRVCVFLVVTWV